MRIGCATFLRFTNSELSHPTFKHRLVVRGFCTLPIRPRPRLQTDKLRVGGLVGLGQTATPRSNSRLLCNTSTTYHFARASRPHPFPKRLSASFASQYRGCSSYAVTAS